MKQIELKRVESEDQTVRLDYKELILQISKTHPQGITIDQMEKAIRVITKTKSANGVLNLEDADWETLKAYIQAYPFAIADPLILQFAKDVSEASEAKV
jgi:poly-D-alanine transfer protein DltD